MTIDLFIRDQSGRVIASVKDNLPIQAVPVKVCACCAGGKR